MYLSGPDGPRDAKRSLERRGALGYNHNKGRSGVGRPENRELRTAGAKARLKERVHMEKLPRDRTPEGTDAAVGVTDNVNAPWLRPGDTMYISHTTPISAGELGVFYVDGKLVCRQYVEDCEGNIYLFAANRARRDADITVPAGGGREVLLVGRVLLPVRIPLPGIE